MKHKKFWARWLWPCLMMVLCILLTLSCFYFHYEFQAKTGLWRRRNMLIYVLPGIAAFLLSLPRPRTFAPKWNSFIRALYVVLAIVVAAHIFQRMAWDEPLVYWVTMKPRFVLVNISITAVIYMAVWLLIWDSKKAAMATFWLMYVLGYLYFCVGDLRGATFKLADLTIAKTALDVLGKYRYPFTARHVFWAVFGIILLVIGRWVPAQKSKSVRMRIAKMAGVIAACIWMGVLLGTPLLSRMGAWNTPWEIEARMANAEQGALSTLMFEAWEMGQNKPEGYTPEALAKVDPSLMQEGMARPSSIEPNVVVIINESLADLQSLWQIPSNADAMPFLHSLRDRSVWGNMYSSSYGGQTCNVEFSFLTGTIPIPERFTYLMSATNTHTPSLAWQFKAQGYRTTAIHPARDTNYQRDIYYPLLGMDEFLDITYFENIEYVNHGVSDRTCYQKIISLFDDKQPDEKLFVFNVTIQNHGDYLSGDAGKTILLEDGVEDERLQQYLNSVYHSDQALQELCAYFEQQEEPTLLLMFGDHHPDIKMSAFAKQENLPEMAQHFTEYITPFVIWANYPIEPAYIEGISANYLAALLMERGGLAMTHYDKWLMKMAQKYPVVLLHGYADHTGRSTRWDQNMANWPQEMRELEFLRYNRLFDEDNRLPALRRLTENVGEGDAAS